MKRSAIPRRTELKRTAMKRKPPKYPPRDLVRLRKRWERQQSHCHICHFPAGVETHHIALKSQAPGRFEHPANWLWICRPCHRWLHETGDNRHHELLEIKRVADPEHYDRSAWLKLAGKPESYLD